MRSFDITMSPAAARADMPVGRCAMSVSATALVCVLAHAKATRSHGDGGTQSRPSERHPGRSTALQAVLAKSDSATAAPRRDRITREHTRARGAAITGREMPAGNCEAEVSRYRRAGLNDNHA